MNTEEVKAILTRIATIYRGNRVYFGIDLPNNHGTIYADSKAELFERYLERTEN